MPAIRKLRFRAPRKRATGPSSRSLLWPKEKYPEARVCLNSAIGYITPKGKTRHNSLV